MKGAYNYDERYDNRKSTEINPSLLTSCIVRESVPAVLQHGRYHHCRTVLGEDALAAVGATGSIMFLVLGFASGLAQGFGVMVSQAFGAKDESRLKHIVALSFLLTIIISVVLTALTVTTSRELLIFMNTPDNILDMADSYIRVIFWGIITSMMYNVVSGILRGVGDSKTPLYFLLFSSALNIVLDLFCIVTLKLNVAGAAYATVISQGISAVLCLIYMYRKFTILRTRKVITTSTA